MLAGAQKSTTITPPSGVKRLTRIKGSRADGDYDVALQASLNAYHTVAKFKAQSVRPGDDKYADQLAFAFLNMICDFHAAIMLQQLMSGCINWRAVVISTETARAAGSFTPPPNWKELSNAALDLLTPSNSAEDCTKQMAAFQKRPNESVTAYATRHRSMLTRFDNAAERATKGRSRLAAYYVVKWETVCFQQSTLSNCQRNPSLLSAKP